MTLASCVVQQKLPRGCWWSCVCIIPIFGEEKWDICSKQALQLSRPIRFWSLLESTLQFYITQKRKSFIQTTAGGMCIIKTCLIAVLEFLILNILEVRLLSPPGLYNHLGDSRRVQKEMLSQCSLTMIKDLNWILLVLLYIASPQIFKRIQTKMTACCYRLRSLFTM